MTSSGFYSSPDWLKLRRDALKRDNWACVQCGRSVRGKGQSRVDHIKPRKDYPELALVLGNVRTLCPTCDNRRHAEKGHGGAVFGVASDGTPLDPAHPWNKAKP